LKDARALIARLESQEPQSWHVPDQVWVGVLAGLEEYETWLQAHLLRCAPCRAAIIDLLGQAQATELFSDEGVACALARNDVMHFLEAGRPLGLVPLHHVLSCEACSQTFYEPASAAAVLEFDPDDVGEAG